MEGPEARPRAARSSRRRRVEGAGGQRAASLSPPPRCVYCDGGVIAIGCAEGAALAQKISGRERVYVIHDECTSRWGARAKRG